MNDEITVLDLFSGIGGFSLGLESAGPFRTVAFCEQDKFCQAVLRKHWPSVPIYDDVRTIDTDGLGRVNIIVGGFPCQPWSQAGQQRGAADDRDLWPTMAALIEKLQPRWVIGENVRGFVSQRMGLERSLSDLARIGYSAIPFVIPACAVNAPHRRDRVWIIGAKNDTDTDIKRSHRKNVNEQRKIEPADGEERVARQVRSVLAGSGDATERRSASVADAGAGQPVQLDSEVRGQWRAEPGMGGMANGVSRWLDEPDTPRVASGVKNRVPRLKALGNAVCPQVVAEIGKAILAAEDAV